MANINEVLNTNEDGNKFWKEIQNNSTRRFVVIDPPLNSIVHKMCSKLLMSQYIIWIGGPPGSGKTTCSKRFQNYGFMAMDGEDPWASGVKNEKLTGLIRISEKVHEELNCSFVFGACFENYLIKAPKYVIPILLLPSPDVYERRWKKRNKGDCQDHEGRYRSSKNISEKFKETVLTLHQPSDECVDTTIYRICELIIEKYKI